MSDDDAMVLINGLSNFTVHRDCSTKLEDEVSCFILF